MDGPFLCPNLTDQYDPVTLWTLLDSGILLCTKLPGVGVPFRFEPFRMQRPFSGEPRRTMGAFLVPNCPEARYPFRFEPVRTSPPFHDGV